MRRRCCCTPVDPVNCAQLKGRLAQIVADERRMQLYCNGAPTVIAGPFRPIFNEPGAIFAGASLPGPFPGGCGWVVEMRCKLPESDGKVSLSIPPINQRCIWKNWGGAFLLSQVLSGSRLFLTWHGGRTDIGGCGCFDDISGCGFHENDFMEVQLL